MMDALKRLRRLINRRLSLVLPNAYWVNYAIMAPKFRAANGRRPKSLSSPSASLNDFVFDRMIRNRWTAQQIRSVDKELAKHEARVLCDGVKVPRTMRVVSVSDRMTPADLFDEVEPYLGQRLVAKPTHGSGAVVFLDDTEAPGQLEKLLQCAKTNFFGEKRETQYTYLDRKIIIEENVSDTEGAPLDYKFFCFGGVPEFCQIDVGRFEHHHRAIFDVRTQKESSIRIGAFPRALGVQLPDNFLVMAQAAQALAKPFDVVRIDLYSVGGEVYFSEFTFSPHAAVKKVENDADVIKMVQRVINHKASRPSAGANISVQAIPGAA